MKILDATRYALMQRKYKILALGVLLLSAVLFLISSSLIQIYPFFINYSRLTPWYVIFTIVFSVLLSLNLIFYMFNFRLSRKSVKKGEGFGAAGVVSSFFIPACAECVPLALSVFGVSFGTWSAFFQPFILEIQILTVILLIISLHIASSHICNSCKIKRVRK